MDATTYLEQLFAKEAANHAAEARKPFAFMLPSLGGWCTESRYTTREALDAAVGEFVEEYRDDNGFAPLAGKDFLAGEFFDYATSSSEHDEGDRIDAAWDRLREEALNA